MKSLAEKVETLRSQADLTLASGSPLPLRERVTIQAPAAVFRLEGDYWTMAYQGSVFRLKDSAGARYLSHLLQEPQTPPC